MSAMPEQASREQGADTPSADDLRQLRRIVRGTVLTRDDSGYAEVCTGYNHEVRWDPEVVVRCCGVADVRHAVRAATRFGMGVAVRSGGTGTYGAPPGSLLVDLQHLRGIDVVDGAGAVRAQAGATWRDVDQETAAFGVAAPGAQTDHVGVAGYVLGGGFSWLGRQQGWAADHLLEVGLVTSAGEQVTASADREPDLFWAVRGSGWNFGVVTSMTLRTHRRPDVIAGEVLWRGEDLADVLRFWDVWTDTVPDALSSELHVLWTPPGVPADGAAQLVRVGFCLAEDSTEGSACIKALMRFGRPLMAQEERLPYLELQGRAAKFLPPGMHQRFRMLYLDALDDRVIAEAVRAAEALPPLTLIIIHHYRGALAKTPEDATAMSHRNAKFNVMTNVRWWPFEDGAGGLAWQENLLHDLRGEQPDRAYVNYLFDEPHRVASAYSNATLRRLGRLKEVWDPENLFRHNANVQPGETGFP